ncbi:ATP-dependent Clp protease proteolytic subunit [Bradyrhizobium sp. CW10]|uniref:ATP-dependent Clp protease proteolytic subunit n=1 Tax=Bradyrhizobium sp. CW10 TaxID=2782683 RepID=UPI001FF8B83D|nr:ATP-dependent Clp protease proteolytic subunit [Bradyrhizobium sp. CW10]MCK1467840.1 ATP-dependent Clp protease proteolytic subunit [Bradyrhizobium sp. CW10]
MTDGPGTQSPQPPNEVYGLFAGPIDQMAVARIANAAAISSSNGVTHVHLAFQSSGGTVADGVALYNLFRAFPVPLSVYNIGSIASAGVLAYLGARNRLASSLATFMIHRTTSPHMGTTSDRLQAMMQNVILDDARIEAIFRSAQLELTAEQRDTHKIADLWLSAEEAISATIATGIGEFGPPKGQHLFFVGSI